MHILGRRSALLETSGKTQVLNFVIFPKPEYDLPIFGADLVSLPGVHLVCLDLQPAVPESLAYTAQLEATKATYQADLPWAGDLPEKAQQFFSPVCIWSKVKDTQVGALLFCLT